MTVLLIACGGSKPKPKVVVTPPLKRTLTHRVIAAPRKPGELPANTVVGAAPLSTDECNQLIDHVFDLGVAEQLAIKGADHMASSAQLDVLRDTMHSTMMLECMRFPRAAWECAMAATDTTAVSACSPPSP